MTEQLKTEAQQPTPRAKLLDLSLTQIIASSLAAATAAALGSRLGVVGTITGAAVGSVISAVAASVYVTSMTRARSVLQCQKVSTRLNASSAQEVPLALLPDTSGAQNVPTSLSPLSSSAQKVPRRLGQRWLGSAAVVFALATAFLLGIQLASGTDVTGTSIGTRPPAAQGEKSPRNVTVEQEAPPSGTPVPSSTAPAIDEPEVPPTETAEPTGSVPPATTPPAEPSPVESVPTPAEPTDATQPPASGTPTTPAS
jgi:hypothetical protein